MKHTILTIPAAAVLGLACHCAAAIQTVDFESVTPDTPLNGLSIGNLLFGATYADDAYVWDSEADYEPISGNAGRAGGPFLEDVEVTIDFAIPVTDFTFYSGCTSHASWPMPLDVKAWDVESGTWSGSYDAVDDLPDPLGEYVFVSVAHDVPLVRVSLSIPVWESYDLWIDNISFDVSTDTAPPTAWDIEETVYIEDTPVTLMLLAADVDEGPYPLEYVISSLPTNGGVLVDAADEHVIEDSDLPYTLASNGKEVRYTPPADFTGIDVVTYYATDGGDPPDGGPSEEATVTLDVRYYPPVIITESIPDGVAGEPFGPFAFEAEYGHPQKTWTAVTDEGYTIVQDGHHYVHHDAYTPDWFDSTHFDLPFRFAYYGELYETVWVCTEGLLVLGGSEFCSGQTPYYDLADYRMVAPLWVDTVSAALCDWGVYHEEGVDNDTGPAYVAIYWDTGIWWPNGPPEPCWYPTTVRARCLLFEDGTIRYDYGSGGSVNVDFFFEPIVGLSLGDGETYQRWYVDQYNLSNAESVLWQPPALPEGMAISDEGVLSGTPTEPGEYAIIVHVIDRDGFKDSKVFDWLIEPSPCPGDIDNSGQVNIDDLFMVLAAWGVCSECPEDLNGDGLVNIDDLFGVLSHWGPCD